MAGHLASTHPAFHSDGAVLPRGCAPQVASAFPPIADIGQSWRYSHIMRPDRERRLLQSVVALACLIPLTAGASGVLYGPAMVKGVSAAAPADLDSHFRYLSGLLLGTGLCFGASIPTIERRSELFAGLSAAIVVGGLARLAALLAGTLPSTSHVLALGMELLVVPLLIIWQRRIARRFQSSKFTAPSRL